MPKILNTTGKCQDCGKDILNKWLFCGECVKDAYKHCDKESKLLDKQHKNILLAYKIESMRKELLLSKEIIGDFPFITNPNKGYEQIDRD